MNDSAEFFRAITGRQGADAHGQAVTTRAARALAVKQTLGGTAAKPMRVVVSADQGPSSDEGYHRPRTVSFELDDPTLADGFVQSYIDGGDEGAQQWLIDNVDLTYGLDRWWFGEISSVDIEGLDGDHR